MWPFCQLQRLAVRRPLTKIRNPIAASALLPLFHLFSSSLLAAATPIRPRSQVEFALSQLHPPASPSFSATPARGITAPFAPRPFATSPEHRPEPTSSVKMAQDPYEAFLESANRHAAAPGMAAPAHQLGALYSMADLPVALQKARDTLVFSSDADIPVQPFKWAVQDPLPDGPISAADFETIAERNQTALAGSQLQNVASSNLGGEKQATALLEAVHDALLEVDPALTEAAPVINVFRRALDHTRVELFVAAYSPAQRVIVGLRALSIE